MNEEDKKLHEKIQSVAEVFVPINCMRKEISRSWACNPKDDSFLLPLSSFFNAKSAHKSIRHKIKTISQMYDDFYEPHPRIKGEKSGELSDFGRDQQQIKLFLENVIDVYEAMLLRGTFLDVNSLAIMAPEAEKVKSIIKDIEQTNSLKPAKPSAK